MQQAAELCGLTVKRGMCSCPFHGDKTPSMKLYPDHYYCFGCHAHGDAVDLVAKVRNLPQIEAARYLADAFHVPVVPPKRRSRDSPHQPDQAALTARLAEIRQRSDKQKQDAWRTHALDVLVAYAKLLAEWKDQYAPKADETWHPQFMEAIENEPLTFMLLRDIDDLVEAPYFYDNYHEVIEKFEQRIQEEHDNAGNRLDGSAA